MQQGSPFFIGQGIAEDAEFVGGLLNRDVHTAFRLGKDPFVRPCHPVICLLPGNQVLQGQVFGIGSESLIDPDILPAGAGDIVSEPLVCQFMGHQIETKIHQGCHGLVFHASPHRRHTVSVLLLPERIHAEGPGIQFHHITGYINITFVLGQVSWRIVNVILEQEGIRRMFRMQVITVISVFRDGQ